MGLYQDIILPQVVHCACSSRLVTRERARLVPRARGRVLEVGMGSGLNLVHYDPTQVEHVWGLEPSEGMRRKATPQLAASPVPVEWLALPGEQIPLPDDSVDTVVLTFTLCTIPDWQAALAQIHRVLRPEGRVLFCEHGAAPDAGVRRWQNRLNPLWRRLAGGCQLNRPIDQLLEQSGFRLQRLAPGYLPRTPRLAGYLYRGEAQLA